MTSDKRIKTRHVEVERLAPHPKYGKFIKHRTICYAHDEMNSTRTGDLVEIMETRPLSKLKRWRIVRVVRPGVQQSLGGEATDFSRVVAGLRSTEPPPLKQRVRKPEPTDRPQLKLEDLVARMSGALRMKTLDEAMAWKRQFNDRRLRLIEQRNRQGISDSESVELEELQRKAETYAALVFTIGQMPDESAERAS